MSSEWLPRFSAEFQYQSVEHDSFIQHLFLTGEWLNIYMYIMYIYMYASEMPQVSVFYSQYKYLALSTVL